MHKKIELRIFKFGKGFRMVVYADGEYYTEHKEDDEKALLIAAREWLTDPAFV